MAHGKGNNCMKYKKFYISCNYSCTISILFNFYWLNKRNCTFNMLQSQSWKNKLATKNVKVKKMVVIVKTFDYYPHKLDFGNFSAVLQNCKRV